MQTSIIHRVALVVAFIAPLACDSGREEVSGGEVLSDSTYRAVDYQLTSDNYNRWLTAQRALDSVGVQPVERLNLTRVTDSDVDRVVASLNAQPAAKTAIERADLSVRDFVLTTVALAQSWDAVNGPSARVVGVRPENLDFLRVRVATDPVIRQRPGRVIVDDDDSDSDSDSDKDSERRGTAGNADSDSEGKGEGRGRGRGNRGRGNGNGNRG